MRHCLLLALLMLLGACAGPLPAVDPQQAWIELSSVPGNVLMADRLDGRPVNDGRYFQVSPGAHELQVRLQFEVPSGGHDGMDWLVFRSFFDAAKAGAPAPIDVYDAAAWMSISCLSEQSVALGGAPVAIPDFTNGKWMERAPWQP